MNWSRAKTILIASFLLLNMILGFQLWSTNRSNQTEISLDRIQYRGGFESRPPQ